MSNSHLPYTGIGSRETPQAIMDEMSKLAHLLAKKFWVLRTGGAQGADQAFYLGAMVAAVSTPEVYLPWQKFENYQSHMVTRTKPQPEAYEIAERFHPRWSALSKGGQHLHARNVHQVMGSDVLSPDVSRFVICYTSNGKGGGGTGQALRIAKHYSVPIFDWGAAEYKDLTHDRLADILPL